MATKNAAKAGGSSKTDLVKWDAALAARAKIAQKTVENVGGGGDWISFRGGQITFHNQVVGNKLEVVIPSFVLENAFYEGKYDPNNPASPICFAFAAEEGDLVPHEKAPQPQCETCAACPHNEWDTGENGRGKACKNQIRIAALPADCLDEGVEGIAAAKEAYAKVPITSVKSWGAFVNELAEIKKHPLAFVTEITTTPDATTQFKVSFKAKEEIPGKLLGALIARADELDKKIGFPYVVTEDKPARPASRAAKKPAGGKAAPARGKAAARPTAAPAKAAPKVTRPAPAAARTARKF